MASIKAIEGRSVHQIQSGQVIVDLNSVVKELVENSLDAGASSIEVRFKDHGLESIEVQDNGKGIGPEDFETVALKHHTSKLSSYDDLTSLDTFGFRGEALSSLCALSRFHILTARAQDGAVGKRLEFETSGQLKGSSVVAARQGTTVAVEDLFCNLPVRRKELEKNIKREYGKVIGLLHAYACISVGVRFTVSNQMPKGKKVAVFSTKSNTTTKENITNIYGSKTLLALLKLDLHLEMEPSNGPTTQSARNWSTQATDRSREVHVKGHISKPTFGEGRQAPDRQMFFVNSRPCGLPQVSKAFNEVYKAFNVSQSPFVFANLVMDTHAYDVNVSPDKRTIMLHDQTALLESLKSALTELFEQTDHTVPASQLPSRKLPSYQPLTVPRRTATENHTPGSEASSGGEGDSKTESIIIKPALPAKRSIHSTPANLIQGWVGRDSESRSETPATQRHSKTKSGNRRASLEAMRTTSLPGEITHETPTESVGSTTEGHHAETVSEHCSDDHSGTPQQDNRNKTSATIAAEHCHDPLSTPYDDLFSQRPPHLPKVAGSNTSHAPAVQPPKTRNPLEIIDNSTKASPNSPDHRTEAGILAVTPHSQKVGAGPVANAFDRMRPKRTPLQTAEITVGDTTTTTVIGSSPAYKRRRIYEPEDSQAAAKFGCSPLLARGLKNFAAPGSQMDVDGSEAPLTQPAAPSPSDDESSQAGSADETQKPKSVPAPPRWRAAISSDAPTSDALNTLVPAAQDDDDWDEDYIDEEEKKAREDEKIARLIREAEETAAHPTEQNLRRASQVLKNAGNRKESTLQLVRMLQTSSTRIQQQLEWMNSALRDTVTEATQTHDCGNTVVKDEIDDTEAESKLSLTVSKADFEEMRVVGQFNLGFVLATRPATDEHAEDDLFIIDQHAADEKYNYERLQRTVTLQSQRLVRPKPLDLTAVEEELIINHAEALKANGFEIETTSYVTDDEESASRRCRLLTLPMSKEKTFELSDLEELLHLLSEAPAGSAEIPRPKKVQKMLAMRACRSSIMVGKTLTLKQMRKVVRHMGEMEKPWNCPHGRPTMRHLAGLGAWSGWREGNAVADDQAIEANDWKRWLAKRSRHDGGKSMW